MLSKLFKKCPRCDKSRETYYTVEKDPHKRNKYWRIERCPKCAYNFDIEEAEAPVKKNEPEPKKNIEDTNSYFGRPRGGWLV